MRPRGNAPSALPKISNNHLMKKIWAIGFVVFALANWHCRRSVEEMEYWQGRPDSAAGKPNIIFLLADDMRFDALGCTGNPIARTPNLDSLASQGTNFKNSYVTSSICAISRASILTGQYESRHGIDNFDKDLPLQSMQQTYPCVLRRNGYYTGFIGKYGVGDNPPTRAFDYWKGYAGQGAYFFPDANGNMVHETAMMELDAEEFLKKRDKARPFCLSISFKAPHSEDGISENNGFVPDPYFNSWYANVQFPFPETYDNSFYHQFPSDWRTSYRNIENEGRVRWASRFSTPEKFQTTCRAIYRLVSGIDRVVGRLREYLKANGLDKNTILVFTSDNGYFMGEHGLEGKWYGHEESIRVPLIIYDPRIQQQRKIVEDMVLNIDIAPTILSWADIEAPGQMQGKSLMPLLSGNAANWRTEFFYEHPYDAGSSAYIPKSVGVVTPSWKYMRYYNGNNPGRFVVYEELFNVSSDPHEKNNKVKETAQHDRIAEFRKKIAQYLQQLR